MLRPALAMTWFALLTIAATCHAQKDADEAYVILGPERTLETIEETWRGMPRLDYEPPADRWRFLPRSSAILKAETGRLNILMLGDSIINDTSRSSWELLLRPAYPSREIQKTTVVRGSTGCWWYQEPDRLKRYVIDQKPDLLIIGGISQRDDLDAIEKVALTTRDQTGCDVLLLSPAFGRVDPRDDQQWTAQLDPKNVDDYRNRLANLAARHNFAFLDMTSAWGQYIRDSGEPVEAFKRDVVHANPRGEQILGRILAAYLKPD